mmetsp:Transcript_45722/g.75667  ORF Transcript_45722/g.75667 Transcript_45722/m.75667 type:complete len:213 (+) Transcript_45722:1073-1711(+)
MTKRLIGGLLAFCCMSSFSGIHPFLMTISQLFSVISSKRISKSTMSVMLLLQLSSCGCCKKTQPPVWVLARPAQVMCKEILSSLGLILSVSWPAATPLDGSPRKKVWAATATVKGRKCRPSPKMARWKIQWMMFSVMKQRPLLMISAGSHIAVKPCRWILLYLVRNLSSARVPRPTPGRFVVVGYYAMYLVLRSCTPPSLVSSRARTSTCTQ